MEFMSLLTWFLSTAMGIGHNPSVAGGGPVARATTTTATAGVRTDVAGGGPVAKKTST